MSKKGFLALLLGVLMVVGLLAGCDSGSSGSGSSDSGNTQTEAAGGGNSNPSTGDTIKIGYVNPTTGSLAGNGEGCQWVVDKITNYVNNELGGIEVDGTKKPIQVIVYDSQSDQNTCSEMADKLCTEDEVDMLIAIQTPETAIPVETKAEQHEVPCVGIQAPVNPCAYASDDHNWSVHAFWTIEKIYEAHKALWTAAGYGPGSGAKIGLAFANDADGTAWHDIFAEKLPQDGYEVVDPGQYPSGTNDFSNVVKTFQDNDIDILAGTNVPPDFSNLFTQMIAAGIEVDCITMGKCCLLPGDVVALGDNVEGIMSEVWWAPNYPYTSKLTGVTCAELGQSYEDENGGVMPQPAGYAYAALELAVEAFQAAGTTDKATVMEALRNLDTETIVGPIKYDQEMNNLQYSETVIAGGQWQKNDAGEWELVVIDSTVYPELEVAITGEYKAGNATQK
jgi:branched-chain amino acid transport system substrate-binding protein